MCLVGQISSDFAWDCAVAGFKDAKIGVRAKVNFESDFKLIWVVQSR